MKTFKKRAEPFEYKLNLGDQFAHLQRNYADTKFWAATAMVGAIAIAAIIANCIIQLSNH